MPCISYIQTNDISQQEGDTIRYSLPTFQIKVWCNDIADLSRYMEEVDYTMFKLRFKRKNYNELTHNNILCGIAQYQALAIENYEGEKI